MSFDVHNVCDLGDKDADCFPEDTVKAFHELNYQGFGCWLSSFIGANNGELAHKCETQRQNLAQDLNLQTQQPRGPRYELVYIKISHFRVWKPYHNNGGKGCESYRRASYIHIDDSWKVCADCLNWGVLPIQVTGAVRSCEHFIYPDYLENLGIHPVETPLEAAHLLLKLHREGKLIEAINNVLWYARKDIGSFQIDLAP